MQKSDFLKKLSTMSRGDIRVALERDKSAKVKKISPCFFVKKYPKKSK